MAKNQPEITPRFIRLKNAPAYLGMDRSVFERDVRPKLQVIRIGKQGIAFDLSDLDAWADEYKEQQAKEQCQKSEDEQNRRTASSKRTVSGTSTNISEANAFEKALARRNARKQKKS